jgi:hypothetical protein
VVAPPTWSLVSVSHRGRTFRADDATIGFAADGRYAARYGRVELTGTYSATGGGYVPHADQKRFTLVFVESPVPPGGWTAISSLRGGVTVESSSPSRLVLGADGYVVHLVRVGAASSSVAEAS